MKKKRNCEKNLKIIKRPNYLPIITYNCDPFVFGPEFAIDKIPRPVCDNCGRISSSNFSPHIDFPPRPVLVGSPP